MIPGVNQSIIVRGILAAAFSGAAWFLTVRSARAEHADVHLRVAAQSAEAVAFGEVAHSTDQTSELLIAVRKMVTEFEANLQRPPGATPVFDRIEALAVRHAVQVFRIDPKGSTAVRQSESKEAPPLFADEFSIDLAGSYGQITAFLHDLQSELGVVHIAGLRVTPASDGKVRCQVEFIDYRLKPGSKLVNKEAENEVSD